MHAGQYLAIWQLQQPVVFFFYVHVKQPVIALGVLSNHFALSGALFENCQTINAHLWSLV
jgi:hypothetical protein